MPYNADDRLVPDYETHRNRQIDRGDAPGQNPPPSEQVLAPLPVARPSSVEASKP